MTRKTYALVIASVFVSSILLEGQVFAAGERKKIVMVSNSTAFVLLQGALQNLLTGTNLTDINVVHTLALINALAIELPSDKTVAEGSAYLQNLISGISGVQVYDDLVVSVLPIVPAPPPPVQMYDWGQTHIRADVAHEKQPTVTGAGVQVAILDTGVGPHTDLPTITKGYNALPGGGDCTSMATDMGHTLQALLPRGRIITQGSSARLLR